MSKQEHETWQDYLSRVSHNLSYEYCGVLDHLVDGVEPLFKYFELWADTYGTEYWSGIMECIAEGASPGPARAFVRRYVKVADRPNWLEDIGNAVKAFNRSVKEKERAQ